MSNASSDSLVGPKPTWGPLAAVLISAGLYIGAQALAAILLSFGFGRDEAWLTSVAGEFVFILVSDVIIAAGLIYYLRQRRAKPAMLGLGRKPALKDVGYALLGFGFYFLLLAVVTTLLGQLTHVDVGQKQELGFDTLFTAASKLM